MVRNESLQHLRSTITKRLVLDFQQIIKQLLFFNIFCTLNSEITLLSRCWIKTADCSFLYQPDGFFTVLQSLLSSVRIGDVKIET